MAFYKFIDSKDVCKFCGGSMQFKSLEYYRMLEEKERTGRADENDGLLISDSCFLPNGKPVIFKLKMKRNDDFIMCISRNISKKNAEKMKRFGDAVIIIEDEDSFIIKIKTAALRAGYQIICKDVFYYKDGMDKENMDRIIERVKNFSFFKQKDLYAYQQEYRFMIYKNDNTGKEEKYLDIGDIYEIVRVVSVEELCNSLT
ncbi:MAG: hypothetical protein OSJ62_04540 [Lachnospiraceae bacterium]|nr:hypothetical protein [Lachnospiraceae bacterium]